MPKPHGEGAAPFALTGGEREEMASEKDRRRCGEESLLSRERRKQESGAR